MLKLRGSYLQTGFSLIELMISLTLGLLLAAGITTLSMNVSQTNRALNAAGQQLENGRYAINILKDNLHHAGYFGEFVPCYPLNPPPAYPVIYNSFRLCSSGQENVALPAAIPDPCDTNSATIVSTFANSFALPLTGYNSPSSSPIPCIAGSDFASGTDVLVIRRASTNLVSLASLAPGQVYIQTGYDATFNTGYVIGTCTSGTTCTGLKSVGLGTPPITPTTVSGDPATVFNLRQKDPNGAAGVTIPANIRGYDMQIYFIRPWSVDPAESPRVPTLARKVLTISSNAPALTTEDLIEGIESMQVQYGIDDGTAPGIAYDGTADRYTAAPASTTDWSNVVAVKVNLLARKSDPNYGYTDTKSYDLGEGSITPGGNFERHAFSSVVRLINVSGRRECPTSPACN